MALSAGVALTGGKAVDQDEVPIVRIDGAAGGATLNVTTGAATPVSSLAGGAGTLTAGASAQLIALNAARKGLTVSVDTAGGASPVYVLLGAGTASAANFHLALSAGGSWDGMIGETLWAGAVQFFSAGTPKVGVVEV